MKFENTGRVVRHPSLTHDGRGGRGDANLGVLCRACSVSDAAAAAAAAVPLAPEIDGVAQHPQRVPPSRLGRRVRRRRRVDRRGCVCVGGGGGEGDDVAVAVSVSVDRRRLRRPATLVGDDVRVATVLRGRGRPQNRLAREGGVRACNGFAPSINFIPYFMTEVTLRGGK